MSSDPHATAARAPEPLGTLGYLPALDGVRAIAALLVVWTHIPLYTVPFAIHEARVRWLPGVFPGDWPLWVDELRNWIHPGYLGVDLFFVLSGFLITRILLEEKARGIPVHRFLARRSLRIFPIYYLVLALVAVVAPSTDVLWCSVYLSNYRTIEHGLTPYLEHTWSLCVEEHFYLVWPWIVALLPSRKSIALCLGGSAVIAIAWSFASLAGGASGSAKALNSATQFRVISLGSGALLALIEPQLLRSPRRFGLLAFAAAVAIFCAQRSLVFHWLTDGSTRFAASITFWLGMSAFSTALILWTIVRGNSRNPLAALLRSRPLRGIGRISYGLYLYHVPIFALFGILYRPALDPPSIGICALAVATSLAVATASYFAIERPLLRYASRFRDRRAPASAA